MNELRAWKIRRWHRDPRCAWCGVQTVLERGDRRRPPPPNLATVDHLRDRFDPTRTVPVRGQEVRRVLSCLSCNEARGAAREAARPIEELWRRSKSPPGGRDVSRESDGGTRSREVGASAP